MESVDSSTPPPRDTTEESPVPSPTEESETWYALRLKSIHEKAIAVKMRLDDLDLKLKEEIERKEAELMDQAETREKDLKTSKRCRLESEHSLSQEKKGRYAQSLIRPGRKTVICVDSEFNDFSKTISSFVAGQVWALHDNIDYMPRIYGRIEKIINGGSSFLVTWMEPEDKGPVCVCCGRFRCGIAKTIKSHLAFSHVVHPIVYDTNSIAVIPRKGETWALFSDWSKSWNNHKPPYSYDFVEVVVDFNDCLGIGVTYLGKVEGFVSVYKQAEKNGVISIMLNLEEMPRFSHRVPSFKLNGEEKEGVPSGSFELDPAAIFSTTERQREDCGKMQDGSKKDVPIILD